MTGLDALCAGLAKLEVRHVFGLPGTQNAAFFSALPKHGIRPVLATHELSASFMANGYARASGRVGVLATIPGPGFAFAIAGLAEARLDSVPLLHLVGTPARGPKRFPHQAMDQAGIAGPLVKGVVEVGTADEVEARLQEAWRLAQEGEPGPVLLHLVPEALRASAAGGVAGPAGERSAATTSTADWAGPLRALVAAAERPVIFAGAGALSSAAGVQALAERLTAPTFTTLTARGLVPEDHPCSLAFDADRGGLSALNELLHQADLILALGCKFSHNGTSGFRLKLPEDRLVHVNTDAEALGSSYPARLEIQARVEDVLGAIEPPPDSGSTWTGAELAYAKSRIGAVRPPRVPEPRFAGVPGGTPAAFFRALRAALPPEAVVVTDSGLHQVMTRRYLQVLRPGGLVAPADLQSMGFGVPAAIGAAIAEPSRPVVAVVGDGGFLMAAMDLACAARERVSVTVVVFNDGYLNLIRVQQLRDEGTGSAVSLKTPDLEALAAAMAVDYHLVDGDPGPVLRAAIGHPGPTLVEVRLGDSNAMRAMRGVGLATAAARRVLPSGLIGRLKRFAKALRRR
jgi:acetolactate synthase-1/2/3 large subunit